jgi:hypothetical protein
MGKRDEDEGEIVRCGSTTRWPELEEVFSRSDPYLT